MKFARPSGGSMGRTKNAIHFAQAFIIFLAWALTIGIWTKGGSGIDGRTVWYWILCWISMPALIYLAAVPMWPRARRFGNVYAFATVDLLYTIFWFSAWVCLASYVAQGKSIGKTSSDSSSSSSSTSSSKSRRADKTVRAASTTTTAATSTSTGSGCHNWAYGNATKCNLSEAITIIGVVIFILFAVTAWMSIRNVMHFRRTGTLPDAVSDPTFAAQSKAAFSSNPAHDFEEEEDDFRSSRVGGMGSSRSDRDEDYALLNQSEIDDLGNPNGRSAMHGAYDPTASTAGSTIGDYNSTPYGGAHGQHYQPPSEAYTPSEYSTVGYGHR